MKLTPKHQEAISWLRDNPGAAIRVVRIGREIINAVVVWPGMPIAMSPDDTETPDYSVEPKIAASLVRNELVRPSSAMDLMGGSYCYQVGQRSAHLTRYVLNISPRKPLPSPAPADATAGRDEC